MPRSEVLAWLLFALAAALPAGAVLGVAVRAGDAERARVRGEQTDARAAAARDVRARVDAELARAADDLRRAPTDDDRPRLTAAIEAARPALADAVILDADGELVHPAPPAKEASPSATCAAARTGLASPEGRAAARTTILAECIDLRSEQGRYLWPLLALETETASAVPDWLEQHAERLGPAERDVLRARVGSLSGADRTRAERALSRTAAPQRLLQSLLAETASDDAEQGGLRKHEGRWVGLLRRWPSGLRAGFVVHEASLLRAAPGLPSGLALVAGSTGDEAEVRLSPLLALHVASRDAAADDAAATRAGDRITLATAATVALALALAGWLYARARSAQRLADLRTDFVAAVSHELRTPLASVQMLAELLEGGDVPEGERAEVEATLAREARRLSATLTRMLRFGSLARGKLVAARTRVQVAPIARAAAERFRAAHPERELELDLDDALCADCDAGLLGLALDNLLGNAAKYAPEGGPYRLVVRGEGDEVVLAVADRGPGLDGPARRRVFLPFERVGDRLSRATEGTGVGLALVRGIARAHGGDASVESAPGRGATFEVRFAKISRAKEER